MEMAKEDSLAFERSRDRRAAATRAVPLAANGGTRRLRLPEGTLSTAWLAPCAPVAVGEILSSSSMRNRRRNHAPGWRLAKGLPAKEEDAALAVSPAAVVDSNAGRSGWRRQRSGTPGVADVRAPGQGDRAAEDSGPIAEAEAYGARWVLTSTRSLPRA